MAEKQEFKVRLKPWQDRYIFSPKRYPGMWSSWATGKSMSMIFRAMLFSQSIPNNLGIIFRKEYTDLRDSTVKDFERYTGLKVNSNRSVKVGTSEILFRHIEELNNIQNINLGWFAIEQADELPTSNEFFLLFGRLRRQLEPSQAFIDMGLPVRSGFVIGNAGDHWGRELWKDGKLEDAECIEANTLENADVLPQDFLESLNTLKKQRPEIYAQFVLNDWNVTSDRFILIRPSNMNALKDVIINEPHDKWLVAVDPATGGDECVIYAFHNTEIIDSLILHDKDAMKVCGHIQAMMFKHKIDDVAIDVIGLGGPIADRLAEQGRNVIRINSSETDGVPQNCLNRRMQMWDYVSKQVMDRKVCYPQDELIRKQATSIRYELIKSSGLMKMEHKPDFKKRTGLGADRGDTWVYGIWALQKVEVKKKDAYRRNRSEYEFNPATV